MPVLEANVEGLYLGGRPVRGSWRACDLSGQFKELGVRDPSELMPAGARASGTLSRGVWGCLCPGRLNIGYQGA